MIVDTSVLSALLSKDKARKAKAVAFLENLPRITTSVVVIYEVEYGIRKMGSEKALTAFRELISSLDVEIVPVTEEVAQRAAEKRAEMGSKGVTLHTEDLFIGATASLLGRPVATENRKDFEAWNIELVSPLS